MPILESCYSFLQQNAIGKWFESYTMKNKETDNYLHPIQRGMCLLRVEIKTQRVFYWLYNIDDAIRFNEFVGMKLKAEAHEVILTSRVKLFYDIDLKLDEFEKHELIDYFGFNSSIMSEMQIMNEVAKRVAIIFKDATLISLEENGLDIDTDLNGFDWMYTLRNRPIANDGFKISIHLITNLIVSIKACCAISKHIKEDIIKSNIEVLGINDTISELLTESIDQMQYRPRGSLSLPYGTKQVDNIDYTNWIYKNYNIPGQRYFITVEDQFSIREIDLSGYNIIEKNTYRNEACPKFINEALQHVNNIKDYNPHVWDLNSSILKGSTMFVKRYAPSMCSICERIHDNDNTLFLIFNSEYGIASWKCARQPNMKPIIFYRKEIQFKFVHSGNAKQYEKYNLPASNKEEGYEDELQNKCKSYSIEIKKSFKKSNSYAYDTDEYVDDEPKDNKQKNKIFKKEGNTKKRFNHKEEGY